MVPWDSNSFETAQIFAGLLTYLWVIVKKSKSIVTLHAEQCPHFSSPVVMVNMKQSVSAKPRCSWNLATYRTSVALLFDHLGELFFRKIVPSYDGSMTFQPDSVGMIQSVLQTPLLHKWDTTGTAPYMETIWSAPVSYKFRDRLYSFTSGTPFLNRFRLPFSALNPAFYVFSFSFLTTGLAI